MDITLQSQRPDFVFEGLIRRWVTSLFVVRLFSFQILIIYFGKYSARDQMLDFKVAQYPP